MQFLKSFLFLSLPLAIACLTSYAHAQTNVVAFWHFDDEEQDGYDFREELDAAIEAAAPETVAGRFSLGADVDNTVGGNASLEAYLGDASELDGNGGSGFVPYTSQVSGDSYGTTRTIKFDDLRGGGDLFSIGGRETFQVDRNDGEGPTERDFTNDALLYLTFAGTGYEDFQLRFDVEATPGFDDLDPEATDLPESFDIFYRTTGPGGTWFRTDSLNNIPLNFSDLDPANPDPDNQVADTGFVSLSSALNNSSQIEIIINDFVEGGDANNELEIDNIEIVANLANVPEPASATLLIMAGLGLAGSRRRK